MEKAEEWFDDFVIEVEENADQILRESSKRFFASDISSGTYGGPARNIDFELLDSAERPVPDNCGYITVEGRSVSDALADAMCAAAYTAGQILEAMNRLAEILNNMLPSVAEAMQHIEDFFKEITNADPAWIEKKRYPYSPMARKRAAEVQRKQIISARSRTPARPPVHIAKMRKVKRLARSDLIHRKSPAGYNRPVSTA